VSEQTTIATSAIGNAFDAAIALHAGDTAHGTVAGKAGVVLTPVRGRTIFNLRCTPGEAAVPEAVKAGLGLALPASVFGSTVSSAAHVRALWIGPGDWLIVCGEADSDTVQAKLRAALAGASGALTDVGHGYAVLNISGPNAADVLAQGCGLDLYPDVFAPGHCAMTGLAKMRVVIHRLPVRSPSGTGFDVYVARSFANSLWHFVTMAATEYGYRVATPPAA
jgi:sarcosine oxidase subunit gamma